MRSAARKQADSQRVMTFSNEDDVVFFRHHVYEKRGGKEVILHEVGPRFEMQLYQLRLGTLDQVRLASTYCLLACASCISALRIILFAPSFYTRETHRGQ